MAKKVDLRSMSVDELGEKATELRAELGRVNMKRHARRLDKTSDLRDKKRELARVLTIIGEKRRAAEQGAS